MDRFLLTLRQDIGWLGRITSDVFRGYERNAIHLAGHIASIVHWLGCRGFSNFGSFSTHYLVTNNFSGCLFDCNIYLRLFKRYLILI